MNQFSLFERVKSNIGMKLNPILGPIRRRNLNNVDFTIISNNCWGGICYEYFNMLKNSPTVGLYFYPDDYIKFILNLKYYTSIEIKMIAWQQSKYASEIKRKGEEGVPVGKLDDIEIVFLHYHDPKIAKDKWERRKKRINWNNIIIKFSYMNGCTDEHISAFEKLEDIKKFALVPKIFENYKDCYLASYAIENGQIQNDTFYFNKDIDVYRIINGPQTKYIERNKCE